MLDKALVKLRISYKPTAQTKEHVNRRALAPGFSSVPKGTRFDPPISTVGPRSRAGARERVE